MMNWNESASFSIRESNVCRRALRDQRKSRDTSVGSAELKLEVSFNPTRTLNDPAVFA
jgi:hypothetical protein